VDVYGGVILGVLIGLLVAGVAVTQGWLPGGGLAWALIAGLAALVLAISLWERRKRRGSGLEAGRWGLGVGLSHPSR
jgi:hypothetical protein